MAAHLFVRLLHSNNNSNNNDDKRSRNGHRVIWIVWCDVGSAVGDSVRYYGDIHRHNYEEQKAVADRMGHC